MDSQQAVAYPWCFESLPELLLGLGLVKADLSAQYGPFHMNPGLEEGATDSSKQIFRGQSQTASGNG